VVANPRQCKNNCPACSRICPNVAIMFPKLPEAESPLNGDEIGDETALKARARINAGDILGSDVHAALAKRRDESARRRLKRPPVEPDRETP
jgi:ferredoxin